MKQNNDNKYEGRKNVYRSVLSRQSYGSFVSSIAVLIH